LGQNTCPNADFSLNNFSNWVGYTGTYSSCCPTQGIVAGRQTIMNAPGTDPRTGNNLSVLPPGATVCAKLGNEQTGSQAERLTYTLTVTPQSSLFIYKYAVVMEDPGHTSTDQPKFNIRVLDNAGNLIDPVCGFYLVVSSGSIPGFQTAAGSVRWKNWSTVGINLTPYMGQNITVEYTTYDCALGAHYGYAYIACACEPMLINVNFCAGNSTVVLTAPVGFTYQWSPGGATTQSISINNPTIGTTYNCTLTSANGCQVVLQSVLNPTIVTPSFTVTSPLCSNTKTFQSTSTVNQGVIDSYLWNFGNGATSTQQNPTYTYPSTGTYTVTLTITGSMGGCPATSSQQVMVYPPPIASAGPDKNICASQLTTLTASGGVSYQWSNSTNTQSINVNPQTATTYTVTVTDGNGCTASDNAVVNINPNPVASAGPNKSICIGSNITLNGSGGTSYLWSPAATLNNSAIATPVANPTITTTYTVTATNSNGCTATSSMVLTVNNLPVANAGNNNAICFGNNTTLSASGGTSYLWAPAASLSNANIANPLATPTVTTTYTVSVTDANGCIATSNKVVTVNSLPLADAGNNVPICLNLSTILNASGGTTYTWSPATGLSNASIANPVASPTATTTYTVTVTNSNNCSATDNLILTVNPLPNASAGANKVICKGNSVTLDGSGGTGYLWAPSASLNNNAIATPIANPTVTTTYTVTVTNSNGCTATNSMVLTVNNLPNANAGVNNAICIGNNTTLNATGGTSYVWSPTTSLSNSNIANPIATPTATITYSVTVTDANGCTATSSKVVTVNSLPIADAGNDAAICLNLSTNLNASGGTAYTWSPATGLSSSTIANPVASPTATTTYTVTVTNGSNCSATDNLILTVNLLPNASAGTNKAICRGNSTTLDGSGGTSYLWAPAATLNNNAIATPTANPTVTTTYTVTVTNSNGCTATSSMVLTVNTLPNANAGPNNTICLGFNTTLNASGGTAYVWSPASSLSNPEIINPVATPTVTTTYTVTVTDNNGCSATNNNTVTVNALPIANAGTDQIICLNQSANLTASGGAQFYWSTGANSQSINVSPTINTTYTVTVSDNNSCSATDDVFVVVHPLPIAEAGNNHAICIGNNTTLNATGGTSYIWSPAGNLSNSSIANPVASPTATTTYTVTVTDNNGCSATDNMILTINPLPPANAGNNAAICLGHNTTLNASGGTSYLWSPATNLSSANIANPVASPTATTTYTVTVTDINTCSATNSIVLVVHSLPPANAGNDEAICLNLSTTLNASGGSGYVWSPVTGLSNANIANPISSPTITTTYTVTVTDNSGCSATDNMVLIVHPLPPADAGNNASICLGTSTTLNASGGTSYSWSPANTLSNANIANPIASPTVNTTYVVTATDNNGCTQTDNVVISILSLPPANAGNNTAICVGQNAFLTASGGVSYAWNTGGNTATITVSPDSTINYVVTVTDGNECSQTDNVIVTVNYPPPANAGSDIIICTGETGNLNASGGIFYQWSPAAGLSNPDIPNPVANPTIQTTYTVTVTDVNTCTATDAVVVSIFPTPVISFVADVYNGCVPLLVNFTDSSDQHIQSWLWDFGDPSSGVMNNSTQQHPAHLFQTPGTYSVSLTVITTDGCQNTVVYNNIITVYPNPIAAFTPDPAFGSIEYPFITFKNNSIDAYSWFWNFGDPASNNNFATIKAPTHKFSNEGNYIITLTVQSQYGCIDSTSGIIRILPAFSIYIPNAFTPNEDGINDYFKAYGTNIVEFKMYIFDRWGKQMFESNNIEVGWPGRSSESNEPLIQDVYVYKIIAKDIFGETHKYIGHVTLLINR